jgi:CubicO group peptidase (beta-lactamase class C family)
MLSQDRLRYSPIKPSLSQIVLFFLGLLVLHPTSLVAQQDQADDLKIRLQRLEELIEADRVKNHIPGLALAVVKDGKVILAKGFGHSDLDDMTPVSPDTLFAIGSSTKSFTSTLVAMLVEDKKMDWDDPVTKYIPDFEMDVDTGEKEITIRDLLCHRTGFTRMGLIWASGSKSRSEVIQQAAKAKPYEDFQSSFLYNNVMYMTAGVCAGKAVDSDWDQLIAERIFRPLGMEDSSTSITVAQKDPNLSLGYMWDKDNEKHIHLPMRNLDSIGPSGSINSNVLDMAKWIQFQLNDGKVDDQQLLDPEVRSEAWTEQIKIGGGIGYGFGWMLREWQDKKVIEHGGNIDGFSAQVTLLPELNVGYVLLANVTATEMQGGSVATVFDTLFGELPSKDDPLEGIDTSELLGNYVANFGPFDNAIMEVKMVEGKVAVDVPGQTTYELKAPDEDGKWYFALTDQIAVQFNRSEDDKVISITMLQGGTYPEFFRGDYEPKPDLPRAETAPLMGRYQEEDGETSVVIEMRKNRLTADTQGNGVYVFAPPKDDEEIWTLRAFPKMVQLQFNKDEDGKVVSLTRFQGGKETELKRVMGDEDATELPDIEALISEMKTAVGQLDKELAGIQLQGNANFIHQGVKGSFIQRLDRDGRHIMQQNFGQMAWITELYDGEKAVNDSNIGRQQELAGKDLATARFRSPLWLTLNWDQTYDNVEITGEREVDGKPTLEVTFTSQTAYERKVYVEKETGLILREQIPVPNDIVPGFSVTVDYDDFRTAGGITIPFRTSVENPMMGKFETTIESAKEVTKFLDEAFQLPKEDSN